MAMIKDLNKLSKQIYEANKAKGFHEEKHSLEHMLCLVISELMEAVEADRKNRKADLKTFYSNAVSERYLHGENYKEAFEKHIKDTLEDELADAVIRLLDMVGALGLNIGVVRMSSKEGLLECLFTENIFGIINTYIRVPLRPNDRISAMIFNIEALCEVMDIDLWKHVELKLKYNSLRPYKHGKAY